jgi:serine/threonine-protein kinase
MNETRGPEPDAPLFRIATAMSDEQPVDWEAEKRRHPGLSDSIERLRLVEAMMRAAQEPLEETEEWVRPEAWVPTPPAPPLERWGPLRIVEWIGDGGFADVYRAHDPTLDVDLALKLWRPEAARDPETLLAEARRLAKVRHDNVVVVHGADRHDGRPGMWMDFVDGRTLERWLQQNGPLGAGEAAAIGIELCRALAAIHAAGIVHRDLKAQNVMRTGQGRIVLMDFGCAGDRTPSGDLATSATIKGTPLTMAPEQLGGGTIGPPADLYALGVLLYRLVSGTYPIEAANLYELKRKHERRESIPLLDRRPDLPKAFVRVVERALDPDPARRYASAGEMERALREAPGDGTGARPRRHAPGRLGEGTDRHRRLWWSAEPIQVIASLGIAVAIGAPMLWWMARGDADLQRSAALGALRSGAPAGEASRGSAPPPAASGEPDQTSVATPAAPAFAVEAGLHRTRATTEERLLPGARIGPGDALFLEISGSAPMYVYVLDEEASGRLFVLFPAAGLDRTNPIPAGKHRLPGTRAGTAVNWEVTSAGGRERVVVIASRRALPELESRIAAFPTPSPGEALAYGELTDPAGERLRGMGGYVEARPPEGASSNTPLGALLAGLSGSAPAARDTWIWQIELENPMP